MVATISFDDPLLFSAVTKSGTGTWDLGRGDAETWGREDEDAGTWGRGDVETSRRGDAGTWGHETSGLGDAQGLEDVIDK